MPRSVKRSFGLAALGAPIALALTLAACGGDDDGSLGSEVVIQPSSHITTPSTVASTTTPGAPTGQPGDTSPTEQVHEVQRGEFLSGIAADYEVAMDDIVEWNQWTDGIEHRLNPGDKVRIPPGAVIPSLDEDEDEDEEDEEPEDEETATTEESDDPELCPDGERQGTYTVKAGDFPGRVAAALDVTLDQLNAANRNTPGYSGFIVGIEIKIPCGGEETED